MKKVSLFLVPVSALLLTSGGARAEKTGVGVGVRAGYALALGEATKDNKMSDAIGGAVPLQLDLTYAISAIQVGGYVSYAVVFKGEKNKDSDISTSQLNYGLQANYLLSTEATKPWVGVFAGLENLKSSKDSSTSNTSGWQAGLQGGAAFTASPGLTVGPFASFAVGQYGSAKVEGNGVSLEADVPSDQKALHQWLTIGIKGQFDFLHAIWRSPAREAATRACPHEVIT